jgi:transcriptional regulator with XRE-family HTH domain
MNLPMIKISDINHAEAGKRIRAARIAGNISLRSLAGKMHISAPFLSDLERGRRNWSDYKFWQAESLIKEMSKLGLSKIKPS